MNDSQAWVLHVQTALLRAVLLSLVASHPNPPAFRAAYLIEREKLEALLLNTHWPEEQIQAVRDVLDSFESEALHG